MPRYNRSDSRNGFAPFLMDRLPVAAVALLGLGIWFLVSATVYSHKAYLFPGPENVALAAASNLDLIAGATWVTFIEAAAGYLLAIVIGIGSAAAMSQSKLFQRSLYPYAILLQTVPVITVAPIIVLWFGYGITSVIIISLIMGLFPIINNSLAGLEATSRTLVELFAMHHATRFEVFWKLRFPAALPSIFAGLKTSAGLSVIGAIVGEFIIGSGSAQGGLGVQIIFAQGRLNTALLFAEVIAASLLGLAFFQIVDRIGVLCLRHWHESATDR